MSRFEIEYIEPFDDTITFEMYIEELKKHKDKLIGQILHDAVMEKADDEQPPMLFHLSSNETDLYGITDLLNDLCEKSTVMEKVLNNIGYDVNYDSEKERWVVE